MATQGMLQLFTAIDERSAAFLALGMATASGRTVAVVTTSGTAVANLLPAAVEADRSCQPLLLLSADRPERLKNCGANQTVNQESFLIPVCRWRGAVVARPRCASFPTPCATICALRRDHRHNLAAHRQKTSATH